MSKKPQQPKAPESTVADAPRYTAWSVAQTCDVSLRQLQWWDEQGIISPIQIDHKRMYTKAEREKVQRIALLSKAGIQPRLAKRYLTWEYKAVKRISAPTIIKGVLVVPK